MSVLERDLAGRDQRVAGDLAAAVDDHDLAARRDQLDLLADQRVRDRVAGRAEADAAEPIDLAQLALAHRRPQRRQRPHCLPLTLEPLRRHRAGSECGRPLTSAHQTTAAALASASVANSPSGTSRSAWA